MAFEGSVLTKASRFAATGLGATCVHVSVALACLKLSGLGPMYANGIAFLTANTLSYFLNTMWSFEQPTSGRNYTRFIATSLLGLGISVSISGVASTAGLSDLIGLLMVAIVLPPITFLAHLLWTYK
ncbi:MAG: GtrA family protein [Pseudomonadota bacterium]